jgi:prevent-host-death family protein
MDPPEKITTTKSRRNARKRHAGVGSTLPAKEATVQNMTKTVDVKDVAANFAKWLKEVEAGHEVVVTEDHRPVARVVPASESPPKAKNSGRPEMNIREWVQAHAHEDERRSESEIRALDALPTVRGTWTGETVIKGETLADEMFDRS